MNTSTTQAMRFGRGFGRIATAVALAAATVGSGITSAYADDHGHRAAPARHDSRHHGRGYVQPYYPQPYYAPAPVYYAPQPSAGISLFIPINIR